MRRIRVMRPIVFFLALVLVATFLFASCAQPEPTPTPTPTPTPAPTPTPTPTPEPAKPGAIELKFAYFMAPPPIGDFPRAWVLWADELTERTDGKVTVTFYPAESLVKMQDSWTAVIGGTCDIDLIVAPDFPGQFPLHDVYQMPMLGFTSLESQNSAIYEVEKVLPEIGAEFSEVKRLFPTGGPGDKLHLNGKVVHTAEDMKGLRLYVTGAAAEFVKTLGATPVVMPPPDWYTSLQRGVIDGIVLGWAAFGTFKLWEVTDFHLENVDFANTSGWVVMNRATWDSLPPDIQEIMDELVPFAVEEQIKAQIDVANDARAQATQFEHTFDSLTPSEREQWDQMAAEVRSAWAAEMEAQGLPGQGILDEVIKLARK